MKNNWKLTEILVQKTGHWLSRIYTNLVFERVVFKTSPLPKEAKIYAVNHPTTLDPLYIMGAIKEPVHAILSDAVFRLPVLGKLVAQGRHLKINDQKKGQTVNDAVSVLKKNQSVLIFPEGAISPKPEQIHRLHTGAVRIALKAKKPIIPVAIYIDPEFINRKPVKIKGRDEDARWYQKGPYYITFGKPIYLKGEAENRQLVVQHSQHLANRLQRLCLKSKRHYDKKNILWQKRKEYIESRIQTIKRMKILPSYSPRYIQPLFTILTVFNRIRNLVG